MARSSVVVALTTVATAVEARRLAKSLLRQRLAACINIVPGIESFYWWQGKIDQSAEHLLVIKSTKRCVKPLERAIRLEHAYNTPEFLVFEADHGNKKYSRRVSDSLVGKPS